MPNNLTNTKILGSQRFAIPIRIIKKRIVFVILFVLFLHGLPNRTAGASEVRKMSLIQSVELALKNNQDLKLTQNSVQYSKLGVKKEKNDFLPQVSCTTSSGLNNDYGETGSNRDYYTLKTEVTTQLNLFKGFEDKAMACLKSALDLITADLALSTAALNGSKSSTAMICPLVTRSL